MEGKPPQSDSSLKCYHKYCILNCNAIYYFYIRYIAAVIYNIEM